MNQVIPEGYSYDDLLLIPQYSQVASRSEVDLNTKLTPKVTLTIPLISSNMSTITNAEFAIALGKLGGLGVIPRFISPQEEADIIKEVKKSKVIVGAAVGCREDFTRAELAVKAGADILVLDVAHGHMEKSLQITAELKRKFGKFVDIVSGNIATKEGAIALFEKGADCVKVGIGPGSTCITRTQTGCGIPQLTAVMETAQVAKKFKKTIICDGGMKNSGDVVKALAAGAKAIMSGHLFAGTKETPGKLIKKNGLYYKVYNGSTSLTEKIYHLKKLGKKLPSNYLLQIEGVESLVPYRGTLSEVIEKITANIRSGFSYVGAKNIQQLHSKAKFIKVSPIGYKENGAHDVVVSP